MTMQPEHQPEPTAAPRRPLAVDLAIAVVVIAVVVGAVGLLVRGMVGPQPEGTLAPDRAQPIAQATATVTTAGIAATTSAPTGVSGGNVQVAAPTPTARPVTSTSQPVGTATVGSNAAATPRPGTSAAGEAPAAATVPTIESPGGARPMAVATVEPLPAAVDPTIAAQVINAYLRYWDVRVQAMANPASTELSLESVMAGEELAGARKTLSDFAGDARAYQAEVDHRLRVLSVAADEARIFDQYDLTSVRIDASTGEPLPNASHVVEHLESTYVLRPDGGSWKVVGRAPTP